MKIGIYWYSGVWGGADTHLSHLLLNWPDLHDQIVVYYNHNNLGYNRVYTKCKNLPNVRFKKFQSLSYTYFTDPLRKNKWFLPLRVILYFLPHVFYFIQYFQCLKLFKSDDLDYLISDNGGYPASWNCLAAIHAAHTLKIKNRDLLIHHGAVGPSRFRGWFETWIDRKMAQTATRMIAVSHATYQTILKLRDPALATLPRSIIYNGVDMKKISSKNKLDFPYARPVGSRWLAVIGRIELYKGHEDIIDAVQNLSSSLRDQLGIVFIGNGAPEIVNHLKQKIMAANLEKQFVFTGYIQEPPEDLIPFFDGVLVATRDFEGFGLTLAEGMAQGKPVIATRVGAIPEFVKSPDVGLLVEPESPQEMSKALEDFILYPEKWEKKGYCGFDQIQKYSASKMGQNFYNLTREILPLENDVNQFSK